MKLFRRKLLLCLNFFLRFQVESTTSTDINMFVSFADVKHDKYTHSRSSLQKILLYSEFFQGLTVHPFYEFEMQAKPECFQIDLKSLALIGERTQNKMQ